MSARFQDRGEKDLFGQYQAADKKIVKKTRILLPRLKKSVTISYENIIFLAIGLAMSCVICFSLGVEKGRRNAARDPRSEIRETRDEPRTKSEILVRGERPGSVHEIENIIEAREQLQPEYIIQLAAFKKRDSAEQEKEELRRNGYSAGIKKSGDYYQLYIGGFSKRKYAEQLVKKLIGKYKDCYIKEVASSK